jgi:transposase
MSTNKSDICKFLKDNLEIKKVLDLVSSFKSLLHGGDEISLEEWISEAELIDIQEINSFIKLIKRDYEAVHHAIIYSYSNGLIEGHNTKIKLIKRQMYGRCAFNLLRLKILA